MWNESLLALFKKTFFKEFVDSSIINPVCLVWMISPKIRTFWEFNFLNTFSKVSNIALLSHAIFVSSDLW